MTRIVWRRDIDRVVAATPGMRAVVGALAERIAEETRRNAPRESGRYKAGIEAVVDLDKHAQPIGRVNANHWTSHIVEFGSISQSPHAPMRRAVDSVGGRIARPR